MARHILETWFPDPLKTWLGSEVAVSSACYLSLTLLCSTSNTTWGIFLAGLHTQREGRIFKRTGPTAPTRLATRSFGPHNLPPPSPVWPGAHSSTRAISYLAFGSGQAYTRSRRGQGGAVIFESAAACVWLCGLSADASVWVSCAGCWGVKFLLQLVLNWLNFVLLQREIQQGRGEVRGHAISSSRQDMISFIFIETVDVVFNVHFLCIPFD